MSKSVVEYLTASSEKFNPASQPTTKNNATEDIISMIFSFKEKGVKMDMRSTKQKPPMYGLANSPAVAVSSEVPKKMYPIIIETIISGRYLKRFVNNFKTTRQMLSTLRPILIQVTNTGNW